MNTEISILYREHRIGTQQGHTPYLTTSPAGTADCLSNHVIDFKLFNVKKTQKSEQAGILFLYKCSTPLQLIYLEELNILRSFSNDITLLHLTWGDAHFALSCWVTFSEVFPTPNQQQTHSSVSDGFQPQFILSMRLTRSNMDFIYSAPPESILIPTKASNIFLNEYNSSISRPTATTKLQGFLQS